jgi:hypothetical protein
VIGQRLREQPTLWRRERPHGCKLLSGSKPVALHLVEQADGGSAGFLDSVLATGEAESPQMGDTLEAGIRDPQELPSPNGMVEAVSGPIPGHAQDGTFEPVFRHAGEDVGVVVLDMNEREAGADGMAGGEIVGMGIAHDRLWFQAVQPEEVFADTAKGLEGLRGLQVADVLTDEDLGVSRDGHRVLEMRTHRQQWWEGPADLDREGGIAARASQDQFASQEHPGDRVVHVPSNGSVVDQEEVGDPPETSQGIAFVGTDRLIGEISARGDDRRA